MSESPIKGSDAREHNFRQNPAFPTTYKNPPFPSFPFQNMAGSSSSSSSSNGGNHPIPARFVSSSIKVPLPITPPPTARTTSAEPFSISNIFSPRISETVEALKKNLLHFQNAAASFQKPGKYGVLCSASLGFTNEPMPQLGLEEKSKVNNNADRNPPRPEGGGVVRQVPVSRSFRAEDQDRVLISEVLVRNKDGEELENKELEEAAIGAIKACRPNSALTVREVQEDVLRVIHSGFFSSCVPVAVDTRDGIRLIIQVEPNQEFRGMICEGANAIPVRIVEDAFRGGYGKMINIRSLDEALRSINGWYMERGLFGSVSDVEILSGGILKLQISEAEVNNISIRFLDRKTGEPTMGKTQPETILQQLTTKKDQVYSLYQGKRDVETVLTMGIMEDVNIIPQPASDTGKVDLTMNVVERASGGFSAGGGFSSGITSGPLSGLIGSFAYSHRNLFGCNKKLNVSIERGHIDSTYRINYTDPWIEGDDKRTSRSITIQNSTAPGTLIHGSLSDQGGVTIARVTAGVEYSRPIRPKWRGTAGIIFQHAGARDDKGTPIIKDAYGSPLTFSGNAYDDMLIAKLETVYTSSGDHGSSVFAFSAEQGLPVLSEWLCFNRVNFRARTGRQIGPAKMIVSLTGGNVLGNFSPHEAFAIGGTNSVRGYEEGAVGSGRSYVVGSSEVSCHLFGPVDGAIFADYGSDLGSGPAVPGDPAGARGKPGSGYGYGVGIRVDSPLGPLRLEYAFNDRSVGRFHFGIGYRN